MQLVNPALYAELARIITEPEPWALIQKRFSDFSSDERIICHSRPLVPSEGVARSSILRWWEEIEQESIRLSLSFRYLATADISDCYGSIYTHIVASALHTRQTAKNNRNDNSLVGNRIDYTLQDMHSGQSNGIPQGNMLSDLIAEIVLGYADEILSERLSKKQVGNFKILRYRDDYRIFTNTAEDARSILLTLTEVLEGLNFRLNAAKTHLSDDVIVAAMKPDKLHWLKSVKRSKNLAKQLLLISDLGRKFPNSGALIRPMKNVQQRAGKLQLRPDDNEVLVALVADLIYRSPRIHGLGSAILSELMSFEQPENFERLFHALREKFSDLPNIGFFEIWFQRISYPYMPEEEYHEGLCRLVADASLPVTEIWAFDWLDSSARIDLESVNIVDRSILSDLSPVIDISEVDNFGPYY